MSLCENCYILYIQSLATFLSTFVQFVGNTNNRQSHGSDQPTTFQQNNVL